MIIPVDFFVDPLTKEKLKINKKYLENAKGIKYKYDSRLKFWNFIPTHSKDLNNPEWKVWEHLQNNGVVSYEQDPINNLGVGHREDFFQFAKFCNFKGTILDIGVGPQRIPSHLNYKNKNEIFFIGLDPLKGEQPRDFAFVQGLGEYLPFRNKLFDQILYVTSIDHIIDPIKTLNEAIRVLKDDGAIFIWIGEKHCHKHTKKVVKTHEWYERLKVPEGAEDRFHYKRFTANDLEKILAELDLNVSKKKEIKIDEERKNLFYKIVK